VGLNGETGHKFAESRLLAPLAISRRAPEGRLCQNPILHLYSAASELNLMAATDLRYAVDHSVAPRGIDGRAPERL